jgi:hypothetical protein
MVFIEAVVDMLIGCCIMRCMISYYLAPVASHDRGYSPSHMKGW